MKGHRVTVQPDIVNDMKSRGWIWRLRRYSGPEWMQRRVDHIRRKVARFILDLAEQVPRSAGGFIHRLQDIREDDRKWTTRLHQSTRPPDGTSLSYVACCQFEVFPVEEFDILESGIRRLFPRTELNDRFDEFRGSVDDFLAGGWTLIGTLVQSGSRPFSPSRQIEEMELPEYVSSVEVRCHRLLPSLFAVSLHVVLKENATKALIRVQSSHYLPEVRFWPIIPTGTRYRSTTGSPDSVALQTLTAHLKRVRSEIEDCFVPFLSGHFMKRSGSTPRLPAVEIYQLGGAGTGTASFRAWKLSTRPWWMSMGFNFDPWNAFQNQQIVFHIEWLYTDDRRGYAIQADYPSRRNARGRQVHSGGDIPDRGPPCFSNPRVSWFRCG